MADLKILELEDGNQLGLNIPYGCIEKLNSRQEACAMKISIGRENLKRVLEVCEKMLNAKLSRAELRCVRMEAKADKAFIQTMNLEEWLTIPLNGAKIEVEGAS